MVSRLFRLPACEQLVLEGGAHAADCGLKPLLIGRSINLLQKGVINFRRGSLGFQVV
jgi:hypothetical protein